MVVSSEYIIGKTIRDFKIDSSAWVGDAVDWIGDAIEAIGYHCGLVNKSMSATVSNHRAALPCDLAALRGVEYNGARLLLGSDISNVVYKKSGTSYVSLNDEGFARLQVLYAKLDVIDAVAEPTIEDLNNKTDVLKEIAVIVDTRKLSYDNMSQCVLPYYNVNLDYIQTSFQEGEIVILYKGFRLDSKGFPMIVDSYKYREAVKWFLIKNTLLQGYKHPTIDLKLALSQWEDFRFKASNEQKMPSLDMLERFHNRWHSIKRGAELYESSFINAEQPQGPSI